MSETIEIPAFDFSGFYYPQILEALLAFKRDNVPELTDESPQEPFVQLLRAFACTGHLNNALLDLVANEFSLPTSKLVGTVRDMLRLIAYEMPAATPAQADVVYQLSQVLSSTVEVLPVYARVASRPEGDEGARYYEALEALSVDATDELTSALAVEDGVYTDVTTEANSAPGVSDFDPWTTPQGGDNTREGDSIIFAHSRAMHDRLDVTINVAGANLRGVWEYHDGNWEKDAPTSVTDQGTYLELDLTGYLGAVDLRGTLVRVMLNATGAYEDVWTYYSGAVNKVDTAGLLGQAIPSTDAADYTVGAQWERLSSVNDGTDSGAGSLIQSGKVTFALPQTLTQNWQRGTFEGVEAYWMRFRLTVVAGPVSPTIGQVLINEGTQYTLALVTQGRLQSDDPLGTSDGTANQRFEGTKEHYIDGTGVVTVDDVTWTEVADLLSSRPTDRHYVVELAENDRPVFVFGDGVTGAIPAPGVGNVSATYHYGADEDGNVGANTIVADKQGLTYVDRLWNPRPATGWKEAAGSTEASLEEAKIAGPASLRVGDVALGPDDVSTLAKRASTIDSTIIGVSRSIAIEELYGPKTIGLVVVPAGGEYAMVASLAALSEFFNGDQFSTPTKPKRLIANQEVTAANYTKRTVDVTVHVDTTGDLTVAQVENQLTRLLQPEALQARDGVTYVWSFGGRVPVSKLEHEIFNIDSAITDVDVAVPASDITLTSRELPYVGALVVTIN